MKFLNKKNKFLILISAVFVFMATTALSLSSAFPETVKKISYAIANEKEFPPVPVFKNSPSFPVLSSQGVLAVDLESGVSLYEKNPDKVLLPASTTKIVTALVALDNFPLNEILTVPYQNVVGQKMGLYQGQQFKFQDLLYGLLVYSANDAAEAIAANYPGGRDAFIAAMNQKAKDLNMVNSSFQNPVGLDSQYQSSTARDLVRVSEVALRNPDFAKIVATKNITVTDITGKNKYYLKNINELLETVPGVMGVKTGWTENARENLVTYLERDGHKILIVVLGSQDRFGETKELINWIGSSYEWKEVKPY